MQNEINYYTLDLPNGHDYNVTMSLIVATGNPDLYVMLCTDEDCTITLDQIQDPDATPSIHYSAHETGADEVKISHAATKCENSSRCQYIIAVYGNSLTKSVFSISA